MTCPVHRCFLEHCFPHKSRFRASLLLDAPHFPEHVSELEMTPLLRQCISHLLIAISHCQPGPGELLRSQQEAETSTRPWQHMC